MHHESLGCIFCGTADHPALIIENGYIGRKCPTCGLIYLSPRPPQAAIQAMYHDDDTVISANEHIAAALVKRLYAKHQLAILRRHKSEGTLLEIGAGAGYFLAEARRVGFEVHGIELNQTLATFMSTKLGISCENSPFSATSFQGKRFDLIYLCNVLSHLYDPILEFQKMAERLTENGLLVFETGNLGDVAACYLPLVGEFDYPEHLFFFSERNISLLLQQAGLECLALHRYLLLPQLLLSKIARGAKQGLKKAPSNSSQPQVVAQPSAQRGSVGRMLRAFLAYGLRYRLGAFAAPHDLPHTFLVLARKRPQLSQKEAPPAGF